MYDTGLLSLLGLALQVAGLAPLSYDLFRSKSLGDKGAQFTALQDQLDASSRELMFNLNKHVDLVSDFFGKLLVVIAREEEYKEMLRDRPNLAHEDPQKYALIQDALDKGPSGLRRRNSELFLQMHGKLKSAEQIEKGLELNAATSKQINQQLHETFTVSNRLRWMAWVGVTMTAAGAIVQLVDMIW